MVKIKELETLFSLISPKASFAGCLWACFFTYWPSAKVNKHRQYLYFSCIAADSVMIIESLPWFQCIFMSKVISYTITCSVLFLNSSWMNMTPCSADALEGLIFSNTQKIHVTSDLFCKDSVGILPSYRRIYLKES